VGHGVAQAVSHLSLTTEARVWS